MKTELIIDGNAVYEIDVDCQRKRRAQREVWLGPAHSGLELMSGTLRTDAVTCCLLGLLLCSLWTHGK